MKIILGLFSIGLKFKSFRFFGYLHREMAWTMFFLVSLMITDFNFTPKKKPPSLSMFFKKCKKTLANVTENLKRRLLYRLAWDKEWLFHLLSFLGWSNAKRKASYFVTRVCILHSKILVTTNDEILRNSPTYPSMNTVYMYGFSSLANHQKYIL